MLVCQFSALTSTNNDPSYNNSVETCDSNVLQISLSNTTSCNPECAEAKLLENFQNALSLVAAEELVEARRRLSRILRNPLLKNGTNGNLSPQLRSLLCAAHKNLGRLHFREQRWTAAVFNLTEALSLDEEPDITVYFDAARGSIHANEPDRSFHLLRRALELRPTYWPCLDLAMDVTYGLHLFEYCLFYCRQALLLEPCFKKAIYYSSNVLIFSPRLDAEQFDAFFSKHREKHTQLVLRVQGADWMHLETKAQSLRKVQYGLGFVTADECAADGGQGEVVPPPPTNRLLIELVSTEANWMGLGQRLLGALQQETKMGGRGISILVEVKLRVGGPLDDAFVAGDSSKDALNCTGEEGSSVQTSSEDATNESILLADVTATLECIVDRVCAALDQHEASAHDLAAIILDEVLSRVLPSCDSDDTISDLSSLWTDTASTKVAQESFAVESKEVQELRRFSDAFIDMKRGRSERLSRNTSIDSGSNALSLSDSVRRIGTSHPLAMRSDCVKQSGANGITSHDDSVEMCTDLDNLLPPAMAVWADDAIQELDSFLSSCTAACDLNSLTIESPIESDVDAPPLQPMHLEEFCRCVFNRSLFESCIEYLARLARCVYQRWPSDLVALFSTFFSAVRRFLPSAIVSTYQVRAEDFVPCVLLHLELQIDSIMDEASSTPNHTLYSTSYLQEVSNCALLCHGMPETLSKSRLLVRLFWVRLLAARVSGRHALKRTLLEHVAYLHEQLGEDGVLRRPNCRHQPLLSANVLRGLRRSDDVLNSHEVLLQEYEAAEHSLVMNKLSASFATWNKQSSRTPTTTLALHLRLRELQLLHDSLHHVPKADWPPTTLKTLCCALKESVSNLLTCVLELHEQKQVAAKSDVQLLPSSVPSAEEWLKLIQDYCSDLSSLMDTWGAEMVNDALAAMIVTLLMRVVRLCVANHVEFIGINIWLTMHEYLFTLEQRYAELFAGHVMNAQFDELSVNVLLMHYAHEYLGRRKQCSAQHGRFLKYLATRIHSARLTSRHSDLDFLLEQAFLCMFNFSRKRSTLSDLEDHGCAGIVPGGGALHLQWDLGLIFYDYFKPSLDRFPEFDSTKVCSISADFQAQLERLIQLIPDHLKVSPTAVNDFIFGMVGALPDDASGEASGVIGDMFYLLGDFYLKNNDFFKAVKFYLTDLSYKTCRFDSWAGMALARCGRLQQRLCLTGPEASDQISVKHVAACMRCFEQALTLRPNCAKLMTEQGIFAYEVHSYANRRLVDLGRSRLGPEQTLPIEEVQFLVTWRRDMLVLAEKLFCTAAQLRTEENEDWLYAYMRGKCSEKSGATPLKDQLRWHVAAAEHLQRAGAKYPRRINIGTATPLFSLEAVEVHYRVYAIALKELLRNPNIDEVDLDELENILSAVGTSPFARHEHFRSGAMNSTGNGVAGGGLGSRKRRKVVAGSSGGAVSMRHSSDKEVEIDLEVKQLLNELINLADVANGSESWRPVPAVERCARSRARCLEMVRDGLVRVLQRLPQHYKALYMLSRFYEGFGQKAAALDIVWGRRDWSAAPHMPVQGLFADHRANNFFHGIWRFGGEDVDRHGSFAAHLGRITQHLLHLLAAEGRTADLLSVSQMLAKPPASLGYLREVERRFLSQQALSLAQSLKSRGQSILT